MYIANAEAAGTPRVVLRVNRPVMYDRRPTDRGDGAFGERNLVGPRLRRCQGPGKARLSVVTARAWSPGGVCSASKRPYTRRARASAGSSRSGSGIGPPGLNVTESGVSRTVKPRLGWAVFTVMVAVSPVGLPV